MAFPNKRTVEALQRRTNEYFYSDTATIVYRTVASRDSFGQPVYSEIEVEVECSFNEKPKMEMWKDIGDFETLEAEIRFTGTKPTKGDAVILNSRFGRTGDYSGTTYEIVGIMDRDVFGYVCALKRINP